MKISRKQLVDAIVSTSTKTAAIEFLKCSKPIFYRLIKMYNLTEIELQGLPKESRSTISKEDLLAALERNQYRQTNTAEDLGVVKSTIGTLMVRYDIPKVSISNQLLPPSNYIELILSKADILNAIKQHGSHIKAAKSLGLGKDKFSEYVKHYEIPTRFSKNKAVDWDDVRKDLFDNRLSVIEVCDKYEITRQILDSKGIDVDELTTQYNTDELKRIFNTIDFSNQGVNKKLKILDKNVFKSIVQLTENHKLTTDKLTERCYRIVNDYSPIEIDLCKWCGDNLLFYTFALGYGNSHHKVCEKCHTNVSGVSPASQKLFWDIIEYGSDYFRKIVEQMNMRKQYLEYKGYKVLFVTWLEHQKQPEETLQKCLNFLKF